MRRAIDFLPEIHAQIKSWSRIRPIQVNQIPIEFGAARVPIARPTDQFFYFGRVDHQLTARDSLSVRSSVEDGPPTISGNDSFGERFASNLRFRHQSHALSHTHVFGPAVVNELRISFIDIATYAVLPSDAGMRTQVTGLFTLGPFEWDPFARANIDYQVQNVLTWTDGRHSLKFGTDLILVHDILEGRKQSFFDSSDFEEFFNNNASSATFRLGSGSAALRFLRQSYFAQDDFKLSPTLTLNLGVRYQFTGIPAGLWGSRHAGDRRRGSAAAGTAGSERLGSQGGFRL